MVTRWMACLIGLAAGLLAGFDAGAGPVLDRVKENGYLRCGVLNAGTGLAALNGEGQWAGFFIDMCRAVATAVTGSPDHVEFIELTSESRFKAVRDGTVDIMTANATFTMERDTTLGVSFPMVYLYDGQGFIAHKVLSAKSLAEVKGGSVCVNEATTTIVNLEDYIRRVNSRLSVTGMTSIDGAYSAFFNHHCDLFTHDRISLFAIRLSHAPKPEDYIIFPEIISKEPLAPVVAAADPAWASLVKWVIGSTILAEEKGVTSANAAVMKAGSTDAEVRRLLGARPGFGAWLGLNDDWAFQVITRVGNYAEVFDRHIGRGSPLRMDRGINALWSKGGLIYVPPLGG